MLNYSKDVSKDTSKAADLIIAETIRMVGRMYETRIEQVS